MSSYGALMTIFSFPAVVDQALAVLDAMSQELGATSRNMVGTPIAFTSLYQYYVTGCEVLRATPGEASAKPSKLPPDSELRIWQIQPIMLHRKAYLPRWARRDNACWALDACIKKLCELRDDDDTSVKLGDAYDKWAAQLAVRVERARTVVFPTMRGSPDASQKVSSPEEPRGSSGLLVSAERGTAPAAKGGGAVGGQREVGQELPDRQPAKKPGAGRRR